MGKLGHLASSGIPAKCLRAAAALGGEATTVQIREFPARDGGEPFGISRTQKALARLAQGGYIEVTVRGRGMGVPNRWRVTDTGRAFLAARCPKCGTAGCLEDKALDW
jgi:hypothetical protein